jgi:hypothetical protein
MVISDADVDSAGGSAQAAVMKALEQKLGSPIDHGPQVPPPKPLVIIISGPSGVGKDAVIKVSFVPLEEVGFIQVFWSGGCQHQLVSLTLLPPAAGTAEGGKMQSPM